MSGTNASDSQPGLPMSESSPAVFRRLRKVAGRRIEVALATMVVSLSILLVFGFRTSAARAPVKRVVLGRSIQGRPIVAFEVGEPGAGRRDLVVGCIHGDEKRGSRLPSASSVIRQSVSISGLCRR